MQLFVYLFIFFDDVRLFVDVLLCSIVELEGRGRIVKHSVAALRHQVEFGAALTSHIIAPSHMCM